MIHREAKFSIGQVVRHRFYPFRGVVFDVDPTFSNTEEWWQSIPENVRPRKDQPYYHLLAENEQRHYMAAEVAHGRTHCGAIDVFAVNDLKTEAL